MSKLRKLDEKLWVLDAPFTAPGGLALGGRATIIALSGGGVAAINPVALDAAAKAELEALGSVRVILAPNAMHHLHLEAWRFAFPNAKTFVSPLLAAKKPGLHRDGLLGEEPQALYRDDLRQLLVGGMPKLCEYVFYHPVSRTLVQTDSAFHIRKPANTLTKIVMRLNGGYGRYGPTNLFRFLVKDKKALAASLRKMGEWSFERIIVAHGDVVEHGGKDAFRRAYERYLRA